MNILRTTLTYLMTSRLRDWLMVAPAAAVALALATIGFTVDCTGSQCQPLVGGFFSSLALMLRLRSLPSPSPPELVVAPFLIPGVALLAGARLALRNLRREMRVVWAHRLRDHVIVCGLGDTGRHIIENLHEAGQSAVVITSDIENDNAAACEQLGIPVLKGDAQQPSLLTLAGLPYASLLVATCGSDAVNLEIGLRALDALVDRKPRSGIFRVLPEMRSQWLIETIWLHRSAALGSDSVEFRPFNLYSGAVREVLRHAAFDRGVGAAGSAAPRFILAGFGETNTHLVLQAVQNFFAVPGGRFRATVFDDKGAGRLPALQARFPGLMGLADIDFVGCTFDVADPSAWSVVDQMLGGLDREDAAALAVVVALSDDAISLHVALQFRERLDRLGGLGAPVFVRLRDQSRLGRFMASLEGSDVLVTRLAPFGDIAALTKPGVLFDSHADALARALHAGYLETAAGPSPAAVPWSRLPEIFKHSNRLFADHLPIALHQLGIRIEAAAAPPLDLAEDEIEALAAMEHWRWSIERQSLGWTQGEPRDDIARRHPLLIPWADLGDETREQNRRLVRGIPKIAAAAGVGLRRERFIALSGRDAAAESEIAALGPNERGILLLDPQNVEEWATALRAVEERSVKIWVVWRAGAKLPAFPTELRGKDVLRAAVENWIGERDGAAFLGRDPCAARQIANGRPSTSDRTA